MLKVVCSEKFYHFVCTLAPLVLLGVVHSTDVVGDVKAQVVVVLLHVVVIVSGAQTVNRLSFIMLSEGQGEVYSLFCCELRKTYFLKLR